MRQEVSSGNPSIISRELEISLRQTLEANQQAILFLNRRGTSTLVRCRKCGYTARCPRCSITLTYHKLLAKVVCHRCGFSKASPQTCPQCLQQKIGYFGYGTQAIEDEIRHLFPNARPARWDLDTASSQSKHKSILAGFLSGKSNVLIGTQMIAKGLDLPGITLAGLVNADIGLIVPDFRACERTFQLLCQVAGRAGRGFWPGRVIVQTYCPNHYAIQLASKHDYATFYKKELAYRRQFNYPPFSKMIRMVFNHSNANRCRDEAKRMAFLLTSESKRLGMADMTVMGPTPAPVQRLRGRYRWQIVLRGIKPKDLLDMVTVPSGWSVDVDPIGVL
jgi:primosomal protein N' (replication factor Y)